MGEIERLVSQLQKLEISSQDTKKCQNILTQIKIGLLDFKLIPPFTGEVESTQTQLTIARQAYELACLLSVRQRCFEGFERHFAQLKTFYFDYSTIMPASDQMWPMLGLNLMGLLAHNRIAEFHTELELIPVEGHSNSFVRYALRLEQYMMEGSYSQLLEAATALPTPYYAFFAEMLANTVRTKIADCAEKAYASLTVAHVTKLLSLKSAKETQKFGKERSWRLNGDIFSFAEEDHKIQEIPSTKTINDVLMYAHELERII
eukprot:203918_1